MNSRAIYSANPSREKSSKQDFLRTPGTREFDANVTFVFSRMCSLLLAHEIFAFRRHTKLLRVRFKSPAIIPLSLIDLFRRRRLHIIGGPARIGRDRFQAEFQQPGPHCLLDESGHVSLAPSGCQETAHSAVD